MTKKSLYKLLAKTYYYQSSNLVICSYLPAMDLIQEKSVAPWNIDNQLEDIRVFNRELKKALASFPKGYFNTFNRLDACNRVLNKVNGLI